MSHQLTDLCGLVKLRRLIGSSGPVVCRVDGLRKPGISPTNYT